MDLTTKTYLMKRGDIIVHSKIFATTKLKKWVYLKQSGYKSVKWGVYMINDSVVEINENQKVETANRVGYI